MQRLVIKDQDEVTFVESDEEVEHRIARQKELGVYGLTTHDEFNKVALKMMERFDARVAAINLFGEEKQVYVGLAADDRELLEKISQYEARRMDKYLGWCTHTMSREVAYPLRNVMDAPRLPEGPLTGEPVFAASYLGAPLADHTGKNIGTACLVRGEVTKWSRTDVAAINAISRETVQGMYLRAGLEIPE